MNHSRRKLLQAGLALPAMIPSVANALIPMVPDRTPMTPLEDPCKIITCAKSSILEVPAEFASIDAWELAYRMADSICGLLRPELFNTASWPHGAEVKGRFIMPQRISSRSAPAQEGERIDFVERSSFGHFSEINHAISLDYKSMLRGSMKDVAIEIANFINHLVPNADLVVTAGSRDVPLPRGCLYTMHHNGMAISACIVKCDGEYMLHFSTVVAFCWKQHGYHLPASQTRVELNLTRTGCSDPTPLYGIIG